MKVLLIAKNYISTRNEKRRKVALDIVDLIQENPKVDEVKIIGLEDLEISYNTKGVHLKVIKGTDFDDKYSKYELTENIVDYIKNLGENDIVRFLTYVTQTGKDGLDIVRLLNNKVRILNEGLFYTDDKEKADFFMLRNKDLLERWGVNLIPNKIFFSVCSFEKYVCDNMDELKHKAKKLVIKTSKGIQGNNIYKLSDILIGDKEVINGPSGPVSPYIHINSDIFDDNLMDGEVLMLQELIENDGDYRFLQIKDKFIIYKRIKGKDTSLVNNVSKGGEVKLIYQDVDSTKKEWYVDDKKLIWNVNKIMQFIKDLSARSIKKGKKFDFIGWDFFITNKGIYFVEFNVGPGSKGPRKYGLNPYKYLL